MFLDLFGCNMFGIYLGALTLKLAGVSRINWIYKKIPLIAKPHGVCDDGGFILRALSKFTPDILLNYDWAMFDSLTRYT